ncbi:rho guanine nucleotide exchange factor 38-like [Rhincodon typus]|uniref:rho guanine nucleotide exchange factor 38-like n=1 Tax=Rhincodon typus TaxID=259920 RepID=UPI00202FCA6B|nr:rho guanine nucleotide exchange factor 38-like [Rhincodon typus]
MEPSIASPGKRRNLGFFKPKLYIQERRRTDTIITGTAAANDEERCGTLRRTQSDRTEYSHKLKAKMTPHAIPEAPVTPNLDPEEQRQHMMGRRLKVIKELVETEKDHFNDLDLCITQVVQPLREKKVECLDVDGLFSNIESVHQISAKLLSMLEYAIAEDEPEMQMIDCRRRAVCVAGDCVEERSLLGLETDRVTLLSDTATFTLKTLSWLSKKKCSKSSEALHGERWPQAPQQTEDDRAKLLATHSPDKLFQAKRKFNAAQDLDASLHEGEIVAVLEKQDPLGSVNRWLIDTGVMQGYVYSSFLRPYNPATGQSGVSTDGSVLDEDFDDISLFVSSPCGDTNNARNLHFNASDGGDPLNDSQEMSTPETSSVNGNDDTSSDLEEQQIFYAVYPFEARSKYELSLQEYERVTIVKSSDLSGNPDWWLAEVKGKRGYVPANYLGRMTYA